jgi:Phage integrase family.
VNEICQAAWAEFDIEAGLWTLPAARSKNHRTHLVPLSPPVVALLEELREVYPGDWLFPYRNMAGAAKPWGATALAHAVLRWQNAQQTRNKRAENAQKPPDMATNCAFWRPQDLRRTMKTWAVSAGIGRDILDRVQNHNRSDVASKHYDKYSYQKEN